MKLPILSLAVLLTGTSFAQIQNPGFEGGAQIQGVLYDTPNWGPNSLVNFNEFTGGLDWSSYDTTYLANENISGMSAGMEGNQFYAVGSVTRTGEQGFQTLMSLDPSCTYIVSGWAAMPEVDGAINDAANGGALGAVYLDGVAVLTFEETEVSNFSFNFTPSSSTATIGFGLEQLDQDSLGNTTSAAMMVDNLSITKVPEPSAALLFAITGILGLALGRRRR